MSEKELTYLLKQIKRCRTVAAGTSDERTRNALLSMAKEYEEQADASLLSGISQRNI